MDGGLSGQFRSRAHGLIGSPLAGPILAGSHNRRIIAFADATRLERSPRLENQRETICRCVGSVGVVSLAPLADRDKKRRAAENLTDVVKKKDMKSEHRPARSR